MFALIDCNNFFVSCERVFRPDLWQRPVTVLSNNDGCIISRSQEVKALGVRMGVPYFECRNLLRRHHVTVFSSNFALYGDLSGRVMDVIEQFGLSTEIYSIDEAFVDFSRVPDLQMVSLARDIRERIMRCTGIPVSVGIACTKTLAKAANDIAKQHPEHNGVRLFRDPEEIDSDLARLPVGDVWGVGRSMNHFFIIHGIRTAHQLKYTDAVWVEKQWKSNGIALLQELRGHGRNDLHTEWEPRKGIMSSRSFGKPVNTLAALEQATAEYMSVAAEKLRDQGSVAEVVSVFLRKRKDSTGHYRSATESVTLPEATAYTPTLVAAAHRALKKLFESGRQYGKAGVWLTSIAPNTRVQMNLLARDNASDKHERIMSTVDAVNSRWGRRTIFYANTGIQQPWSARREFRSPRYTSSWTELPVAHA